MRSVIVGPTGVKVGVRITQQAQVRKEAITGALESSRSLLSKFEILALELTLPDVPTQLQFLHEPQRLPERISHVNVGADLSCRTATMFSAGAAGRGRGGERVVTLTQRRR